MTTNRDLLEILSRLDESQLDESVKMMIDYVLFDVDLVDLAEKDYVQINDADDSIIEELEYKSNPEFKSYTKTGQVKAGQLVLFSNKNDD